MFLSDNRLSENLFQVPALQPEDYDDHFRFCGTPQFETHLLWMAGGRLPLRFKRLAALGVNTQHHYTGCKSDH